LETEAIQTAFAAIKRFESIIGSENGRERLEFIIAQGPMSSKSSEEVID